MVVTPKGSDLWKGDIWYPFLQTEYLLKAPGSGETLQMVVPEFRPATPSQNRVQLPSAEESLLL